MPVQKISRADIVKSLLIRDGNICAYPDCNKTFTESNPATIDHFWIPQSFGGGWELENLKLMHRTCNSAKGDLIPNSDGTLPKRPTKERTIKVIRPEACDTCMNGRILFLGEICPDCGSGPQPKNSPKSTQKKPRDCSHSGYDHCWMCFIGHVPRKSALEVIITGE